MIYKYGSYRWSYHKQLGVKKLNKDGTENKKAGKGFWHVIDCFLRLSDEEKEKYKEQ